MSVSLTFRALQESVPGARLGGVLAEYWPAYQRWLRRAPALPLDRCLVELQRHMPELLPAFDQILRHSGGDERVARFLTLWSPPPLIRGCTQVVLDDADGPLLLRAYDHHPRLFDGLILRSDWDGVPVVCVTDCLWGALDGVNAHGLAVALAFGGRNAIGPGFASPLVVRYLLQTCATVADAREVLDRVPLSMPYTFVIADRHGDVVTAHAGPDRPTRFTDARASANHDAPDDWPEYEARTHSVARLQCAEAVLQDSTDSAEVQRAFLQPPLWRDEYDAGFGTLYVAAYRPTTGALSLCFPQHTEHFSLAAFRERSFAVILPEGIALPRFSIK